MRIRNVGAVLGLLLAVLVPDAARAAASDWVRDETVAVRLISAVDAVESSTVTLGLQFELADDWKVYWRSPGDAGYPPSVDWSGSTNLADATIAWPAPQRISAAGFETIGYKHAVVLPISVRLVEPGRDLGLRAAADFLACADICVPYVVDLALDLPGGPGVAASEAALIDAFASRVPADGVAAGLSLEPLVVATPGTEAGLRVSARSDRPFKNPDLFVEGPRELIVGRPDVTLSDDGRRALFALPAIGLGDLPDDGAGSALTLTLVDGGRSMERAATLAASVGLPAAPANPEPSLLTVLGLALLGGLILNLMPCVLPVLSIKLLGVVGHGGGDPREVRRGFVASAAGIVATFLALAAVLIGLKQAGAAVGWGIQFQQPWFLTAMALLVTLFACNLWGLFEIRLPRAINDLGTLGGHARGVGGHFLTGVLATLLATPCSAPFLGTAVAFALSRGAPEILGVFAVIGTGLALPYLAVAALPALATRLPRPGRWMTWLRKGLAVALILTAAWLVSVMVAQAGPRAAQGVSGLLIATVAVIALRRWLPGPLRRAVPLAVGGLALAAVLVPADPDRAVAKTPPPGIWQGFDEASIASHVTAGRLVFVDVTADWCLTCQVNKAVVLDADPVRGRLAGADVVAMRADWTRPSESISDYLTRFGRFGIPFNAVYGPGAPDGLPLPELLTDQIVLRALDAAAQ